MSGPYSSIQALFEAVLLLASVGRQRRQSARTQKNPISLRGPGSRLALAEFVTRPQADLQIGAM
jgi:hypothetical protein